MPEHLPQPNGPLQPRPLPPGRRRSQELDLACYATDKIPAGYFEHYDPLFAPWVDEEIVLLEVGVQRGASLLLWRDYFPNGHIVGVDLNLPTGFEGQERIRLFQGDQTDGEVLTSMAEEAAPQGFDIIIDDASHLGLATKATFDHLFDRHLRPGGLYVIEDWGTGYWEDWPDGRRERFGEGKPPLWQRVWAAGSDPAKEPWPTHRHGMVGLVKQLVDEQGAAERLRGRHGGPSPRPSRFKQMLITPGLVVVTKHSGPASE
ncbi:MAG TPA: class I SAM-dependent methyltransferase [Gemmatales bacterium]|nr:class I SAM-dependent methyltransferase [Gemmatales bacterium]HMP58235.1 class I SAM-dependent methyltransferase [Gemmatales bacterium]